MMCDLSGLKNVTLNKKSVLSQNENLCYMYCATGFMLNVFFRVFFILIIDFFLRFTGYHSIKQLDYEREISFA